MQTTNERDRGEADDAEPDERVRNAERTDAQWTDAERPDATPRDRCGPEIIAGPSGLVIRAAEPDDAPAIARLANLPGFRWGTMRAPFQSVATTRETMQPGGPNRTSIVALLDGTVVGSAGLTRFAERRSHAGTLGMGVDDAHVGKGIGTALLAALLDAADNWRGLRRVELTVYADNAPAVRLYERMGFEREGLLRAFALRSGVLVDALAMARLREAPPIGSARECIWWNEPQGQANLQGSGGAER